jgi:hypothetical protein
MKISIPILPSTIGKISKCKNPDGSKIFWKVIDEIRKTEINFSEKILIFQKLQKLDDHQNEMLRFGYYIINKSKNSKGEWIWGQFAPFISKEDFDFFLTEMQRKKWI